MSIFSYNPDDFVKARGMLQPLPDTFYASMLPFKRNLKTGERGLAIPSILRDALLGSLDLAEGVATGQMTPQATATLPMFMTGGLISGAPKGALMSGVSRPSKMANPNSVKQLEELLINKNKGVKLNLSDNGNFLNVSKIVVDPDKRNQGIGTNVMNEIINWADLNKKIVALTPDDSFGGNKNKLIKFYNKLGFESNSGRKKDFRTRETMIRNPK